MVYNISFGLYLFQRTCTRKNYEDNLDDEIEGKRTFSVLDKLNDKRFQLSSFVTILQNANGALVFDYLTRTSKLLFDPKITI